MGDTQLSAASARADRGSTHAAARACDSVRAPLPGWRTWRSSRLRGHLSGLSQLSLSVRVHLRQTGWSVLDVEEAGGCLVAGRPVPARPGQAQFQVASGLGRVLHLRGGRPDQCRRLGLASVSSQPFHLGPVRRNWHVLLV